MNKDDIAREIAYLLEWEEVEEKGSGVWTAPDGREFREGDGYDPVEVFLTPDMIHQAEHLLTPVQLVGYARNLNSIMGEGKFPDHWHIVALMLKAPAIQKAEALLRVLDKWKKSTE